MPEHIRSAEISFPILKDRTEIEEQKTYMLTMVKKTGKKEFDVLEGTCINAKVDDMKNKV